MHVLGIDFGGTGIKGAPVDAETGVLLAPRYRIPTPDPSRPRAVANVVAAIAQHFDWKGPIGCGMPSVVQNGIVRTAANIHRRWIGVDAQALFSAATGCPVHVLNDADAAGLAEMTFGVGKGCLGVVLIVTIGTGLGTALFANGQLMPNTEFGHIEIEGEDGEWRASDAARKREKLSWKKWALRFNRYLLALENLIWPDLIILSGGAVKKHEKFVPLLKVQAQVLPAQLLNDAGIVGAALSATTLQSAG
jgi:polyphosphate glucokinase